MEKVPLPTKGTIVSYTVVHQGQKGFDAQVPYVMAIVEFEGGVTILGQVVDCDPEHVDIGMEVKPVFRRVREEGESGVIHYGYKFAPPCFPTCRDDSLASEEE
jgi:uncharacterized OB-fold protein